MLLQVDDQLTGPGYAGRYRTECVPSVRPNGQLEFTATKMNVYDPSPSDVASWVELGQPTPWPDQDWDMYVCNGLNDDLILAYANDPACIQREFFVHCLYQLVGDFTAWSTENADLAARIEELLANVDEKCHDDVRKWRDETIALRGGTMRFDLNYWVHHLYVNQIPDGR